ncbi:MAG: hypothetical protein AAFU79_03225 [Myxococcota bacterium]
MHDLKHSSIRPTLRRRILGVLTFAATAMTAGFATEASAGEKTRYCDARIRVELKARDDFPMIFTDIEVFSAKGKDFKANEARKEARERARGCARRVWDDRWDNHPNGHGVPGNCNHYAWVYNFNTTNLKCKIYDAVCALKSWQGRGDFVADYAVVWTKISGGTWACTAGELHAGNYGVGECSAAARAAECGN